MAPRTIPDQSQRPTHPRAVVLNTLGLGQILGWGSVTRPSSIFNSGVLADRRLVIAVEAIHGDPAQFADVIVLLWHVGEFGREPVIDPRLDAWIEGHHGVGHGLVDRAGGFNGIGQRIGVRADLVGEGLHGSQEERHGDGGDHASAWVMWAWGKS